LNSQYANTRLISSIECSVFKHKTNNVYPSATSVNHIFPGEVKVFFYPIDKSPSLLYYLSQMNPMNFLSSYFLRSLLLITLSYGPSSLIRIMASSLFSVIISHLFLLLLGGSYLLLGFRSLNYGTDRFSENIDRELPVCTA
jgi:hypothetical protein